MSPGIGIGIGLPFIRFSLNQYIIATGGTITRDGDYLIHTITGTDTFEVTQTGSGLNNSIEYLIVAGGGGGGVSLYTSNALSGGGGGGGYLSGNYTPAVQSYAAVIGGGGSNANGNNSSIFSLTADGGGRGGNGGIGNNGGSGGGGANNNVRGVATVGQGYDGGDSTGTSNSAGGGGGAGGVGQSVGNDVYPSSGGLPLSNSISGAAVNYAGGGEGNWITFPVTDADINSGYGGKGSTTHLSPFRGGNGGSGIIIVRYYSPENPFPANLLTNLISRWKLDGNSNDSIGSNNGTDTAITYSQAKINDGAVFNGTSSGIIVADSDDFYVGTNDFAYIFWVKRTSITNGRNALVCQTNAGGQNVATAIIIEISNNNNIDFYAWDVTSSSLYIFGALLYITDTNWHHIVVTRRANTLYFYKDGVQESSNSIANFNSLNSVNNVGIGSGGDYLGLYYNGQMDEILFYNGRGLTAAEVLQLYNYYNS
jgi:hypothetical protein